MTTISTCSTCRRRKIRCDGCKPACGSCIKSKDPFNVCDYTPPIRTLSEKSRLGHPCEPCRRKKKKCNRDRPACQTCVTAKKEDQCVYGGNPASDQGSEEASSSSPSSSADLNTPKDSDPRITNVSYPFEPYDQDLRSSFATNQLSCHSSQDFDYDPSMFMESLIITPPIPGTEANFETLTPHERYLFGLRKSFVEHNTQLGVCLSEEKLDAIRAGDSSGHVVHPALIYVAYIWGCLYTRSNNPQASAEEEQYYRQALELTTNLSTITPTFTIQALSLLGMYKLSIGDFPACRDLLTKGSLLAQTANLRIKLSGSSPSDLALGADGLEPVIRLTEELSSLCHLIHVDLLYQILTGLPSCMSVCHLRDFQQLMLLPLRRINYVVIERTISAFLLHQACTLLSKSSDPNSNSEARMNSIKFHSVCSNLILRVNRHLSDLSHEMSSAFYRKHNRMKLLSLQVCKIMSLAALFKLHHALKEIQTDARQQCIDVTAKTLSAINSFLNDDVANVCPLVKMCWTDAKDMLIIEQLMS